MKNFTQEEAQLTLDNADFKLCVKSTTNQEHEVMTVLADEIQKYGSEFALWFDFLWGSATGIREERARRSRQ